MSGRAEGAKTRLQLCCPLRKRHAVCFLSFLGMTIIHSMRVNVAITVVTILDKAPHEKVGSERARELPDVDWSPTMVGLLHAMFYVGFLITQIPGGYLATRMPSNRIFGLCISLSCALNLLLPTSIADVGFVFTCFVRLGQGLLEGAVIPSLYKIIHDWSPRAERSTFAAFCLTGMYAGAIIGFPLDGLVTHYANWQYIFYLHSAFGLLWLIFWVQFVYETPEFDPSASDEEKLAINAGRDHVGAHTETIPWRSIFTSGPVWAVIACHFVRSWMFFLLLTNEPAYLNIFNFSILETLWNWQKSFIVTGSVLASGVIVYAVFGSGELQAWAMKVNKTEPEKTAEKDEIDESKELQGARMPNYQSTGPVASSEDVKETSASKQS